MSDRNGRLVREGEHTQGVFGRAVPEPQVLARDASDVGPSGGRHGRLDVLRAGEDCGRCDNPNARPDLRCAWAADRSETRDGAPGALRQEDDSRQGSSPVSSQSAICSAVNGPRSGRCAVSRYSASSSGGNLNFGSTAAVGFSLGWPIPERLARCRVKPSQSRCRTAAAECCSMAAVRGTARVVSSPGVRIVVASLESISGATHREADNGSVQRGVS